MMESFCATLLKTHESKYGAHMYYEIIQQMTKQLGQMNQWLEAAASYAQFKNFDPNVFLALRLAPDQFPLVRQIQITCDTAKLSASRLSGSDAPKHEDNEQTLDALQTRIQHVIQYLRGFSPKEFERASEQKISQPRWEGKHMLGSEYFLEHAIPNFFFHLAHTYAILRHNGVSLGKRDYLGALNLRA